MDGNVAWEDLDKPKFFFSGAGIFSALTISLFPLTVIKTRQQASGTYSGGLRGSAEVAKSIHALHGIRGFYRGFGTAVFGIIPARWVYLSTFEVSKSYTSKALSSSSLDPVKASACVNFVSGAAASIITQLAVVPVDVVSQRLMVDGVTRSAMLFKKNKNMALCTVENIEQSGLKLALKITKTEGVIGLYRGFGMSLATFVPSSSIWWSSYSLFQNLFQSQIKTISFYKSTTWNYESNLVYLQASSAFTAGLVSAAVTNPLDVVKTRVQVASSGRKRIHVMPIIKDIFVQQGMAGFWKGVAPRMINASIWVTAYEFLKRQCSVAE